MKRSEAEGDTMSIEDGKALQWLIETYGAGDTESTPHFGIDAVRVPRGDQAEWICAVYVEVQGCRLWGFGERISRALGDLQLKHNLGMYGKD